MKKRTLGLTMIIVFVFTMSVFAQTTQNIVIPTNCDPYPKGTYEGYGLNLGCGQCAECQKCPIGNIPCPTTDIITVGQGQQQVTTALSPFDFDGEAWITPNADENWDVPLGFGAYGYCTGFNYNWMRHNVTVDPNANPMRDCKFLFDICKCPDACDVAVGTKIGIQMLIDADGNWETHDDGVYFAKRDNGTAGTTLDKIYFGFYNISLNDDQHVITSNPCAKDSDGSPASTIMREKTDIDDADPTDRRQRYIDSVKYYTSYTEKKGDPNNENIKYSVKMLGFGEPLGGTATSIPATNRVVALENIISGDYRIKADEAIGNCLLWIDIPPVRIDPQQADALKGKTIRIKVRIMFDRDKGVCDECYNYCDCVVEIAKICCGDITPTGKGCLFFPYVVQNVQDANGWAAGVAITARETLPANAYVKLTLIDGAGNTATYTNNTVTRIWAFMMEDVMPNFTGAAIIPGPASLQVETNYNIHGYSFMTDGNFGAGTLATGCTPGQCSP